MKPCLQTFMSCGPDMHDPLDQRWFFAVKTVPLSVGISFNHEPSADEMAEAWDKVNESIKKKWLETIGVNHD